MVKKRTQEDGEWIDLSAPSTAGSWAQRFPELWGFLWDLEFDDGSKRSPGSLVLFRDALRLKACLSDKDADLVCFVTADSPDALLEALERGLAEDTLDWRRQQKKRR